MIFLNWHYFPTFRILENGAFQPTSQGTRSTDITEFRSKVKISVKILLGQARFFFNIISSFTPEVNFTVEFDKKGNILRLRI